MFLETFRPLVYIFTTELEIKSNSNGLNCICTFDYGLNFLIKRFKGILENLTNFLR